MTEMSKKQMVQILAYFRVVYTNGAEPDEKTAAVWQCFSSISRYFHRQGCAHWPRFASRPGR